MKIKKIIILIAVLFIVLLAALYFSKKPVQPPIVVEDQNDQIVGNVYTYTNSENGQELKVSYDNTNNTATIYPEGLEKVVFNATTTGSGARYVNEQGLILWNKGDDVSLFLNDSLIFTGTTNVIDTENVTSNTDSTSTTSKKDVNDTKNDTNNPKNNTVLIGNTWVWKETISSNGQKITPKQVGRFTLTFKDGQVSGTTDCNSFGGSYESVNSNLKFGSMMSTMMACMNSQEAEYNQMINKISTYSLDEKGNLICRMSDSGLMIFEKK